MKDKQMSFLALGRKGKVLRKEKFYQEMERVVPWERLCGVIEPFYGQAQTGRPRKELELMLKVHCVQQWQALSDPRMEEEMYDSDCLRRFLGIDLLCDDIPDETTILNFRHLLEEHGLSEELFESVKEHLQSRGLMLQRGTIVDATLIAAPTSTKNKTHRRDPEMTSTKKNEQWHFGMKASVGVDSHSRLAHSLQTATASVHDSQLMEDCLHGHEQAIFGDRAYTNTDHKIHCRTAGIHYAVHDKAARNRPLSGKQRKRNKTLSSVRARVEHIFKVIKDLWGYRKVRYRGLYKNTCQLHTLFALANLYLARKPLLALS